MRKAIICLAALLLMLPCLGALAADNTGGMTVISCSEEGFSTLADFDCTTEYAPGDGLYIKLTDKLMPYVLLSVDFSDTRVTDAGGYLNDRAFCEQWIHYRSSGSYGAARIRQELRRKGVSESEVSEAMESVSEEDQVEAAAVLARRKRRQLGPAEDPYKTKSKIIQYLVRRGFSWDVAKKAYDLTENDE